MKLLFSDKVLLLLWVCLMSSSFVVSADLIPYANSIASTGLRFILASILMIPLVVTHYRPMTSKKVYFHYSLISLFLVLFFVGLFEALKSTTAMRMSVIYTLIPLMSMVFTLVLLKTKTSITKLLGFILGTCGATLVLLASNKDLNKESVEFFSWYIGDSVFIIACFSLSIHVILVKKWGTGVPPIQGSFYIMVLGSLMLLPLMVLFGELNDVAWQASTFWSILLYLTVFTTMATFFLQQHLVQKVGPNQLLAFTYLIPILVVIPEGGASIPNLKGSVFGISITLLALYLISKEQKYTR
ncbi:DMT family transporter [Shewanella sp. VB17]|uniref:DMT family transporter n=1 Tax=Shewanella sp. VB17 TaxID=2739432 RepID=UPI001567493E|nr:DMT family transporter [Shewanella sp. VB17]NRD75581.1 DMT family transporter [Shewanella sp. VB17]